MLNSRIVGYFACLIFFGSAIGAEMAVAQTVAYRQSNLASSVPDTANNLAPGLANPWGIGFLSGQPFFVAENKGGHVTAFDATGFGATPGAFTIPNAAGTGFDSPTGIVADQNSFFWDRSVVNPFIVVTEEGGIFTWGLDANGNVEGTTMIESFLYGTWIGGQVPYWFFLKHQTQIYGARYWEAFHLRLGRYLVQEP